MAYSKATLIKRIRSTLGENSWTDICTEAMDATETGLDVADNTKYGIGSIVEFTDDGEQCLVTALSGATTLTVVRNYNFSVGDTAGTGTSHSISTVITADPVFKYAEIVEAISTSLESLWPYCYREVDYTLTPQTDGNKWYELDDGGDTSAALDISAVTQVIGTGASSKVFRYGERGGAYPISFQLHVPVAKAGSTVALYIPFIRDATNSIFVTAIARITDVVGSGDYSYLTSGVEVDCVVAYAVSRLCLNKAASRTFFEDVKQSDTGTYPRDRVSLSAYWEAKGLALRQQWQEQLRVTLPRMPIGRGRS